MPRPDGTAGNGRAHTLAQTSNALYVMGYSTRRLSLCEVRAIEQRAMAKLRKALTCTESTPAR